MLDIVKYFNTYFRSTRMPSLEAMHFFMDEYNWFEKDMKFIHIAGTNGKGSTTKIITDILIKSGYKVGTIISPHLINYNERISINNQLITNEELESFILELDPKVQRYNEYARKKGLNDVTFYELITTIALLYFYRNKVDFVVMETGMGGLYDGTNIITKPIASVITSIGLDHTSSLGNTLEEIATQKAGIIKKDSDTVIFNQSENVNQVFINKCEQVKNKIHIIKDEDIENYKFDKDYQYFDFKDHKNIQLNLRGKAQIRNTALSLEVIDIVRKKGFNIPEEAVRDALTNIVNHGRMELLNKDPQIIFDGAHNIPAMQNLMEMVEMYYPNTNKQYIVSILERKDFEDMLRILSKDKNSRVILTSGNDEMKYASKEHLYECAKEYIPEDRLDKMELKEALVKAKNGNVLTFVIGSFYVYGTAVETLK